MKNIICAVGKKYQGQAVGLSLLFNKILVAWLALLALCAGLVSSAWAENRITGLSATSASNGDVVVRIEMTQPPSTLPKGFAINSPPRVAFDFLDTNNGLGKNSQDFGEAGLRTANIIQSGNRTRVVINLEQMLAYETRVDGNAVLIALQHKAGVSTANNNAAARYVEAKPAAQKYSLKNIDFRRGKNGEGRVQIDLSDSAIPVDIRQQGTSLVVDFLKTSLPKNLQRKLDVMDFATPVLSVDTFEQGDLVRMMIEPKGAWEHAAYQTDEKFIVEVKPVIVDPNKIGKASQMGYIGDKLTLNFQKIDVREALNVIADFTNLNMVISDTVTGNITLRLKDVPWDQAFEIILQSRGLDMRKNGNVIQVAPSEEIAAKEKISLAAKNEIAELEELRTESFQLSYQKDADIIALLTNAKQPMLSKRGSAVADPRSSTIFVQDTPSRLEEVRKIIKKIDVPVRQVLIEARFVSATDSFNRTLGGKLTYTGPTVEQGAGDKLWHGKNAMRALLMPNSNLPGATSGTGGLTLSLFDRMATKVLALELAASELGGKTKSIASPRIVTKDKVAAKISSGTQIPYEEKTSSGATSTAFKDATLSLNVLPQITPDDHINMQIAANRDTVGAVYSSGPSINTQSVSTEVLVENGGTVVIGGVFTQDIADSSQKVPLLGDVPVVGWLFKNNVKSDNKSELLIFITPKIMKDELSLR